MKYLKRQSLLSSSSNLQLMENYKQFNAKLSQKSMSIRKMEYSSEIEEDRKNPYFEKIYNILKELDEYYSYSQFFFRPMIELGDVKGYKSNESFKNARLDRVDISSENGLAFWIKFDVENPQIIEINRLKDEMKKFNDLSEEEFEEIKSEWSELYDKLNKLDEYIPDFTYTNINSIPSEKLEEIVSVMSDPKMIEINNQNTKNRMLAQSMLNKLDSKDKTYKDTIEYWKLKDINDDFSNDIVPDQEELKRREEVYNKSEEQYNKEQKRMMDLFDY